MKPLSLAAIASLAVLAGCTTTQVTEAQGEICERAPAIKQQVEKALQALEALCPNALLSLPKTEVAPEQ